MASLPEFPKGREFEEFIGAIFQASGLYTERNIIEREKEEILELDLITTNYELSVPMINLIEVKSGKWGFPDIFKLLGWMTHLDINQGLFIANVAKHSADIIDRIMTPHKINLVTMRLPPLSRHEMGYFKVDTIYFVFGLALIILLISVETEASSAGEQLAEG